MYLFLDQLTPDHIEAIAALVQMEMLEAGYATNVEFHYLHHARDGNPYENRSEMAERIMAAAETTGIGLTMIPVHYQYGGCDMSPLVRGQCRFYNDLDSFANLCVMTFGAELAIYLPIRFLVLHPTAFAQSPLIASA